jgi:hypothetical protein
MQGLFTVSFDTLQETGFPVWNEKHFFKKQKTDSHF